MPPRRRYRPQFLGLEERRVPAITFTEVPLPSVAHAIATGPDRSTWFSFQGESSTIGRITPDGQVVEFLTDPAIGVPSDLSVGPDGNLWFLSSTFGTAGRITTTGEVTLYRLSAKHIAAGPDGNLWYTYSTPYQWGVIHSGIRRIGRLTPEGVDASFPIPDNLDPESIVAGPDGALWFRTGEAGRIGRIATDGTITSFPVQVAEGMDETYSHATTITTGPDGNLWFTRQGGVGRITTTGEVLSIDVPGLHGGGGITTGPDGNLWFSSWWPDSKRIGWVTTDGRARMSSVSLPGESVYDLSAGPDGRLWVSLSGEAALVRIDPGGADLAVSVDASPATAGADLTIVYTVTNLGPTPATGVELAGEGLGWFEAIAESWSSQGPIPTASAGPDGFDLRAGLGTIAPGATAVVTIVVRPASVGPIVVRGAIAHAEPDPSPSNDAIESSVVVAPAPIPVPLDTTPPRLMGVTALRAGRRGKGKVTGYVLTFSEAIRPEHLGDMGLIRVAEARVSRTGRIRTGRAIRAASARPAGPDNTVTIALRSRRWLPDGAMITVAGDLTDLAGNRLAGDGTHAGTAARIRAV